jgi:leucyl/phenylalanyl-tRNA--protein transferase
MHAKPQADSAFPPLDQATPDGLLAIGGDLSTDRLIDAYSRGIFPWFNPGQPILWWSPDPRAVLFANELRVSRSLRKTLRSNRFELAMDRAFGEVIAGCAAPRSRDNGPSWITPGMRRAYLELHRMGIAHSVEAWQDQQLVGGLYGVYLGGVFFGESMFSRVTDASKCALAALAGAMRRRGQRLIDCQIGSAHLRSLGAREIPRDEFVAVIRRGLAEPGRLGRWQLAAEDVEAWL